MQKFSQHYNYAVTQKLEDTEKLQMIKKHCTHVSLLMGANIVSTKNSALDNVYNL